MTTIYLVEDDSSIQKLVVYALESNGYKARAFTDGAQFRKAMEEEKPDMVLLDIMLPGESGLDLLSAIRRNPNLRRLPVMMLTAKSAEYDKVVGLDSGADDYLCKPFGMMELLSRIRALLRRSKEEDLHPDISVCGIFISPSRFIARVDGRQIDFTAKEFNLLIYLMENRGIVLKRESILENVWGYSFDGETRTVDVHIRHIREKLGDKGELIETVKGVGYRFRESL
ncbi:MAG: response regulator transcription factor [Candidatus Ornithospirochaeta sp.]|nr:response regulator transcription factor [Candidatus Ornithospirochaeta sp.]